MSQGTTATVWGPGRGWEEGDLSWQLPQGQVPRSCPAVITEGARYPTQLALRSSGHPNGGGQDPQSMTQADCRCSEVAETEMAREVHHCLKTWTQPVDNLDEGCGALQDTAPSLLRGRSSSPAGLRPGKLRDPWRAGRDMPLTSLSTWRPPFYQPLAELPH